MSSIPAPAWVRPGVKVACVNAQLDASPRSPMLSYTDDLGGLREGQVYTIRDVTCDEGEGHLAIRLVEIHRPIYGWRTQEPGYWIGRFRPLTNSKATLEQDVALFKTIAQSAPEHEQEGV